MMPRNRDNKMKTRSHAFLSENYTATHEILLQMTSQSSLQYLIFWIWIKTEQISPDIEIRSGFAAVSDYISKWIHCPTDFFFYAVFCLFIKFWATFSSARSLFLTLYSEISLGGLQELYDGGNQTQVSCIKNTLIEVLRCLRFNMEIIG